MDDAEARGAASQAARQALACLDLTSLNDEDTADTVIALARKADGACGRPAALCVWPRWVPTALAHAPEGVRVAAVVNFPTGDEPLDAVVAQARDVVAAGAHEVDLVLPWRALRSGRADEARALVRAVREATRGAVLKLIIESGELSDPALIDAASRIGLDEGVDFLKTSTGKVPVGATLDAAGVMLRAMAAHPAGARVGFKASGGVRTVDDAAGYIALVREVLGAQAVTPARLRFGASGLLGDIERVLGGGASAMGIPAAAPPSAY